MTPPKTLILQNKIYVDLWTATLQRWGDGSDDLALPIPLEIQQQLGLTEDSVVNIEIVDDRIVMSLVRTSELTRVTTEPPDPRLPSTPL